MRICILLTSIMLLSANLLFSQYMTNDDRLQLYLDVLEKEGKDPIDFVVEKLQNHDLIIFDDALHTSVEPFEFYQKLINTPRFSTNVQYIFVEIFSINKQQHIDAYFDSEIENVELLYPVFQDGFSGLGWSYQIYFDLMNTIYVHNKSLPEGQQLKVIGVSNPTYWSEIVTSKDVDLFRKTLESHDFFMYKTITTQINNFYNGKKGIFLTNSRHAYKSIKNESNELYWNSGTFFNQWNPGKTYSIRFHNVYLFFEKKEKLRIKWDRIANGLWDCAFKKFGGIPIAITLKDNVFGQEAYVGNHMLDVFPNQTMYDANDAIIFLGPLEKMHKTAKVDFIYTEKFKKELERRYKILFTENEIREEMENYNVKYLADFIDKIYVAESKKLLPQARSISSIDKWQNNN